MNAGHHGPWIKVGVPGNMLERFRHSASERLRPGPTRIKFEDPPTGGFMSAVNARGQSRTRTMTRTRYRRKRSRRSFRRRRPVPRRSGFPWKMVRVLKTVKYLSLNPGAAGVIATAGFMLNSCNDPTGSHGTGQPLGFDQYTSVYDRYAVIGARIFVEVASADATNPVAVGLHCAKDLTALTTYEHYKETPNSVVRLMTPEQDKIHLSLKLPISRVYGHRKFLSDDRLSATSTTDPTDKVYCHVFAQPVDMTADVGVVHMICTIYQTVVFYSPKTLARS